MLSGRRAFRGDSAVETMTPILKEEPPELSADAACLPPALERVVRHCLEKSPERALPVGARPRLPPRGARSGRVVRLSVSAAAARAEARLSSS